MRLEARGGYLWFPLMAVALLGGCVSSRQPVETFIVEPEALAEELDRDATPRVSIVMLDVRPREAFERRRPVGATWLDLAEWTRLSRTQQQGFSDTAGWQSRIGALGISNDDLVVVYDGGEMTEAARVWFLLIHFGAHAAVLDGGFPELARVAHPGQLTHGPASPPGAAHFEARQGARAVGLATKSAVRHVIATKSSQILDVRTEAEFTGRDPKNNPRAGRLPGARNLSHSELLDDNGRLRTQEELRHLFAEAGLKVGQPIITHCQSGGRSSLAALAALQAGYGPVSNYYMSFSEWATDEACPVESPPK